MIGKNTVLQILFNNASPMWKNDTGYNFIFINSMCKHICDLYRTHGMICLNEIRNLFGIRPLTIDGYYLHFVKEDDKLTYEVELIDKEPKVYIIKFFKKEKTILLSEEFNNLEIL